MARVRILRRDDVERALPMSACIDAVEAAFVAYSAGRAELPAVIHLDVPEADGVVHVKTGHLHGSPAYAVKIASGFYGVEPPSIDGMVLVFDAATGAPLAFLLDQGAITDLRTGAAGGVAARRLAPERVERVAVIGTGIQARRQVEALRAVRPGGFEVAVWGRDAGKAAITAADVGGRAVTSVEEAVRDAEVILTCTASREPLVHADAVKDGAHITAVGSDGAGKQELDPELLRRADVLAVDSLEQCRRLGELQHATELAGRAVELGSLIAERRGRGDARLTVADLTGVGVQDVAAAAAVLERAAPEDGDALEL